MFNIYRCRYHIIIIDFSVTGCCASSSHCSALGFIKWEERSYICYPVRGGRVVELYVATSIPGMHSTACARYKNFIIWLLNFDFPMPLISLLAKLCVVGGCKTTYLEKGIGLVWSSIFFKLAVLRTVKLQIDIITLTSQNEDCNKNQLFLYFFYLEIPQVSYYRDQAHNKA